MGSRGNYYLGTASRSGATATIPLSSANTSRVVSHFVRVAKAIEPLLAARDITITRYPSLRLVGAKRNCRSDIGLGLGDGPTVWIEAKTAPLKDADLREQLIQQQKALKHIFPQSAIAVITLLPWQRVLPGIPNLPWSRLAELLCNGVDAMRGALPDRQYRAGYEQLAIEIIGRIRSHPNHIVESLPSPNKSSGPG